MYSNAGIGAHDTLVTSRLRTFFAPVRLLATLVWPFEADCRRQAPRIFQFHQREDIGYLRAWKEAGGLRHTPNMPKLWTGSCFVSPNTPPEVEGFQGHVAAKRLTDLC